MTDAEGSLKRAEELLGRLEDARSRLEATEDPAGAIDILSELSEIAREVEAALSEARRAADADA